MRVFARLRDGLDTFWVLAIPVAVVVVGLRSGPGSERMPGESRMVHHIRTCPSCRVGDSAPCHGGCRELAAILEAIRDEAGYGGPCPVCSSSKEGSAPEDRRVLDRPVE